MRKFEGWGKICNKGVIRGVCNTDWSVLFKEGYIQSGNVLPLCTRKGNMGHIDRRKQIMRVVERLASHRRFHEITLDEVADAAKVGKGTIYRYFADKDELFFEVATSGFEELCGLLKRAVPRDTSFAEKLLNSCREITRFFGGRKELLRMMQMEGGLADQRKGTIRRRWEEKRKKLVDALADVFSDGISEGALRRDVSAEVMSIFFLGMLRTRARELGGVAEGMKSCEMFVDIFLKGSGAPGGKGGLEETVVAETESRI